MSFYSAIGILFPKSFLMELEKLLLYAGIDEEPEKYWGRIITLMLLLLLIPPLAKLSLGTFINIDDFYIVIIDLAILLLVPFLTYIHLIFVISSRTERAEEVFPDFLYDIGANLNSGMPTFQAFLATATKKEFGILSEEAMKAYEKYRSENLNEMFSYLAKRFDSQHIKNFTTFFERSIFLGGSLADILQNYANEIKNILNMRKELKERTLTQVFFITTISIMIFPWLLSIAYSYVVLMTPLTTGLKFLSSNQINVGNLPVPKISITKEEMFNLSIAFIFISSITASILISVLRKGKAIFFVKYLPIVLLISFSVFFLSIEILRRTLRLSGI
jgi:pilus assembly protein TadC